MRPTIVSWLGLRFMKYMTSVTGQFMNGTHMPTAYNYNNPSLPNVINGRNDSTSQYFAVGPDFVSHDLR